MNIENVVLGLKSRLIELETRVEALLSAEASVGAIATKTLKKPKVYAFYRRCLEGVANDAGKLVARVYERSVVLHAQMLECAAQLGEYQDEVKERAKQLSQISDTPVSWGEAFNRDYADDYVMYGNKDGDAFPATQIDRAKLSKRLASCSLANLSRSSWRNLA